ncbi:penicillin-binding protein [Rhodococcus sp. 05-2254-6]|nr:penicillin-binding protein [Rhodococcus sp. 05-2254-6]OZE89203.1 penicillin-binding protein [Rhodococcus sp. 15-2388-1-1a]
MVKLGGCCVVAGLAVAGLMFPLVGGAGYVSSRALDSSDTTAEMVVNGSVPAVSTMTDADGNPIAWLYDQRRFEVTSNQISNEMKLAIVSVEDRRFGEHRGVDWQGTLRAAVTNTTSGEVQQGASTLVQQYVKNYQLHVLARTDAERRAAIETTPSRKIREIRTALDLDRRLSKDEILTRYLNLVPFGNSSFGIQDAARTYFGVEASALDITQSAMLAGMVQSSSALNPYTNEAGVIARRNVVLDTMIETIPDRMNEFRAAQLEPLGVLPEPRTLERGCIAAGDRGFFCDYALDYLEDAGISRTDIANGGYLIRTTLDPEVQDSVKAGVVANTSPSANGAASVMNVIEPGRDDRRVLAMASSRTYGLDSASDETVQPQPYSLVGHGGGSMFKIFTAAAGLEEGLGIRSLLNNPPRVEMEGLGNGGARGCPPSTYCVENAAPTSPRLSLTDALAQSPNTAFVDLISRVGVTPTVDIAVRLGLRSYDEPGSSGGEQSMADFQKDQNLGSFTLGPAWINPLEMANVGATLASGGAWCAPNPIDALYDRDGVPVPIPRDACEQVVDPGLADTLAVAMSRDDQPGGTAAAAADAVGWTLPMSGKTGTTESNMSSGFLGFTNRFAGAVYTYGDSPNPGQLCSYPVRTCQSGNLFGGNEPARTWFQAMDRVVPEFASVSLPTSDVRYVDGTARWQNRLAE